jgi:hypothetical protein
MHNIRNPFALFTDIIAFVCIFCVFLLLLFVIRNFHYFQGSKLFYLKVLVTLFSLFLRDSLLLKQVFADIFFVSPFLYWPVFYCFKELCFSEQGDTRPWYTMCADALRGCVNLRHIALFCAFELVFA